jgi:enoyl-CoA hydratase/carnithine racemase
VAVVTIDRPERRNALNLEVKSRIAEVVSELVADDTVRVIVLTGSGDYFVAGTDIAEMATMTPAQHVTLGTDHVFNVMRRCPKPLIAALEGYALGGGCELALTCDMIIAGRSTKLGQPEIRVGIAMGLLSEMVEDGRALSRALELAKTIAAMPPLAVRAIKEVMHLGQDVPLETAFALERVR